MEAFRRSLRTWPREEGALSFTILTRACAVSVRRSTTGRTLATALVGSQAVCTPGGLGKIGGRLPAPPARPTAPLTRSRVCCWAASDVRSCTLRVTGHKGKHGDVWRIMGHGRMLC